MGGGSSKPKASDKSLAVEHQIIQRQQAKVPDEAELKQTQSPNRNRAKSVAVLPKMMPVPDV